MPTPSPIRVTCVFQTQYLRPCSFRPDLNETDPRLIVTSEKHLRSERQKQEARASCSLLGHLYAPADAESVNGVGMPLKSSEAKKLEQNLLFLLRTNAAEALRFRKSLIRHRTQSNPELMSLTLLQATSTYFVTLITDVCELFDMIPLSHAYTVATTRTSPPVEETMMKVYRHCKKQMLQLFLWQDNRDEQKSISPIVQ